MCRRAAKRLGFLLLILAALLASSACSSVTTKIKSDAEKLARKVTLTPAPLKLNVGINSTANKNSPVAVDVVLIKDKTFWKSAPSMAAKDWFAQKSDLQRRYGKKLLVTSWEWVPGQPIAPITVKVPRGVNGAMIFAGYPSPGSHSAPLPRGVKVAISLQAQDFTMESLP
jgi:type VI secretion system protein